MIDEKRNIASIWLCCVVIPLNIYGDFITKTTGIESFIVNGIANIMLLLMIIMIQKKIRIENTLIFVLAINLLISVFHMFRFSNMISEIKNISYIMIFILTSIVTTKYTFDLFKKVLIIITLAMSIDALLNVKHVIALGWRMFNIRNFTMIDKTFYTELFAFAIVILINRIPYIKGTIKKLITASYCVFLLVILFRIFEAKMGISAILVALVAEILFVKKEYRKYAIPICILGGGGLMLFYMLTPDRLPDYVKALIGYLTGDYSAVHQVYYQTYFIRAEIVTIVLKVLMEFPFMGCGFGNYYIYVSQRGLQHYSIGIEDVESAFLEIFAEGGLLYFLSNLILWVALFKKMIRNKKMPPECFALFICLMWLILGNDYMNILYWSLLGILWKISKGDEYKHDTAVENI